MSVNVARGALSMILLLGCSGGAAAPESRPGSAAPEVETPNDDGARPDAAREDAGADASAPSDASGDGGVAASCAGRQGGAFITFNVGAEDFAVWSTNEKFNGEALLASAKGDLVTPVFGKLLDGVDCDGQWSWHVDPDDLAFDTDYDPSCDAPPSAVEANKGEWLTAGRYCPSMAFVSAVQVTPP